MRKNNPYLIHGITLFLGIFIGSVIALGTTTTEIRLFLPLISLVATIILAIWFYFQENEMPIGMKGRHRRAAEEVNKALSENAWDSPFQIKRR